ncbi:MAG TPA: TlpA disulfide reductase family protein [Verrucomicrobiae bacterium]|nr:TlpA disulfide reductase family protein [Verrucomicrobiae bacterium]
MKNKFLSVLAVVALLLSIQPGQTATTNDPAKELMDLVAKVKTKIQAGQKTEKDMADDLKAFDALLVEHKGEKTDAVAQILLMKAMLYVQVLDNTDKGIEALKQLKRDFPDTKPGQNVDKALEMVQKEAEAKKVQSSLVKGMKFPAFSEKDVTGNPLSPDNYKGKVVLIDFWATWCGPCVGELPNVLATYEKHHGKGFEIIGVSLDQDKAKLTGFVKDKKIAWQQYFDGLGWGNKLALKYGVQSIPATYLLDGEGKILGKDLRGEALEAAVTAALAKK